MAVTTAPAVRRFQAEVLGFTSILKRLHEDLRDRPTPALDDAFHQLLQAIRTMSRKCRLMQEQCEDPEELQAAQKDFQDQIGNWFDTSWFMSRAKRKPRGYPGDFELLSAIYDGQPRSTGLGGYLDLYFLRSDLGQAVVARMNAARDFLSDEIRSRDGDVTIFNVASGPCREFFVGLTIPTGRRVTICCIDNDADALKFVEQKVAANGTVRLPDLKFEQYNALRMRSARATIKRFGSADVIYSIGLLDYVPDKHLVPTLQGLRETLKPGGVAYFAFKDERGYDPYEYQWFVDWFFFQRDQQQCERLLIEAGFAASDLSVIRDETGIIMNFVARVEPKRSRRFDQGLAPERSFDSPHSPARDQSVQH